MGSSRGVRGRTPSRSHQRSSVSFGRHPVVSKPFDSKEDTAPTRTGRIVVAGMGPRRPWRDTASRRGTRHGSRTPVRFVTKKKGTRILIGREERSSSIDLHGSVWVPSHATPSRVLRFDAETIEMKDFPRRSSSVPYARAKQTTERNDRDRTRSGALRTNVKDETACIEDGEASTTRRAGIPPPRIGSDQAKIRVPLRTPSPYIRSFHADYAHG